MGLRSLVRSGIAGVRSFLGTERVIVRGYQAGKVDRTDIDFSPVLVGPNLMADQTLALLRRRSQWMADNDPLIGGAIDTLETMIVGRGIYPIPSTEWEDLNAQCEELWWEFAEGVNAERSRPINVDQSLFIREVIATGEGLVHRAVAPPIGEYAEGPSIDLIASARLPIDFNEQSRSGRVIRQGIELDAYNRRVACHVLQGHPADGVAGVYGLPGMVGATTRLDVRDCEFAFLKWRQIGQLRGVPATVLAIQMGRYRSHVDIAFLELLKAMACLGIFFTGVKPGEKILAQDELERAGVVDGGGNPVQHMEPGMVGYIPNGGDLKVLSGNVPPPAYQDMQRSIARLIGGAMGISYGALTKDRSQTSFSSARVEQLDDRAATQRIQEDVIWARHTKPAYRFVVRWGIASGRIKLTPEQRSVWVESPRKVLACEAMMPGLDWVNPAQEAAAEEIAIGNGTSSVPEICAKHGKHFRDVIAQQVQFEKERRDAFAKAGLPVPSKAVPPTDPQRPFGTRNKQTQDPTDPANDEGDKPKPGEDAVAGFVASAVNAAIAAEDE